MTIRLAGQPEIPTYWYRGINALTTPEPRAPEPTQLYHLTTLYLLLHAPQQTRHERQQQAGTRCAYCGQSWPCDPIRLAYRLREGF